MTESDFSSVDFKLWHTHQTSSVFQVLTLGGQGYDSIPHTAFLLLLNLTLVGVRRTRFI